MSSSPCEFSAKMSDWEEVAKVERRTRNGELRGKLHLCSRMITGP